MRRVHERTQVKQYINFYLARAGRGFTVRDLRPVPQLRFADDAAREAAWREEQQERRKRMREESD
jgi:hypothetical protein